MLWRPSLNYVHAHNVDKFSLVPLIGNVCTTASLIAQLILKCFQIRCQSVLLRAYCTFVQAILEYASEIRNPCYKPHILEIQSVQKITKHLSGLHYRSYQWRLISVNLCCWYMYRTLLYLCRVQWWCQKLCRLGFPFPSGVQEQSPWSGAQGNEVLLKLITI